jgi:ribosomal protein S18 acetylase RimI-like enzyme
VSHDRYAVRPAAVRDADALGRVHTAVWHEAYAEVMPADFLASLDPVRAAQQWRLRLEVDEPDSVVAVATAGEDGQIVGFASGGPTRDEDAPTGWELYAINVLAAHHGTGLADELVAAAVGDRPASLWVLVDNARAQAFYRRHGFAPDGASKVHEGTGVPEIRMVRGAGAGAH